jgi:small subunit ribosomal protein S17
MNKDTHVQSIRGTIVKKCSAQTVKIATKVTKVHPLYKKRYSQVLHYLAHDPSDKAEVGQEVTIIPCKPVSKMKRWCLQV